MKLNNIITLQLQLITFFGNKICAAPSHIEPDFAEVLMCSDGAKELRVGGVYGHGKEQCELVGMGLL